MKNTVKNINIIYTATDQHVAENVINFLGEKTDHNKIRQESAVIIVSDDAVKDSDWQREVRELDKKTRLIPIGQTTDVDYGDPEIIPSEIEELNFIRMDDFLLDNIWESLTIQEGFYNVRNTVLVNMDSWITSNKSDAFLLPGYFRVKKCKKIIARRVRMEKDERFRYQMEEMLIYLKLSRKRARKMLFKSIRRGILVSSFSVFFIGLAVLGIYMIKILNRAADEISILGKEKSQANASENVVKLSDGIVNPLINGNIRYKFFDELQAYLDMNWCNTPVGLNYKYRIFSPEIHPNPRYLITTAENAHVIVWDTYTGAIYGDVSLGEPESGVLAAAHRAWEKGAIIVLGDGRIFFGKGSDWITNNVEYTFSGNKDILIQANYDHALIYDDKNVYYFELEPDIRLQSYTTEEILGMEDYEIHAGVLMEDGYIIVSEIYGNLEYYQCRNNDEPIGYNLELSAHENCKAAVNNQRVAFFDADGNLLIFDGEDATLKSVGLVLPSPQFLCFVNDDIIVYYDRMMGTHMYNIRQGYEIEALFEGYEDISFLAVKEGIAICQIDGAYICQAVEDLLPMSRIEEEKIVNRFEGKEAGGIGQVKSVEITEDGTVKVIMDVGGDWETHIYDGGNYMRAGNAVTDGITLKESENKLYYEPYSYCGLPTVVGIIDNGYGIVIGAEDGTFCEMVFRENGTVLKQGTFRVPSHCSIIGIYEMDDCYYLKDESGNYWKTRLGYPGAEDSAYILKQISEKFLHNGVSQELIDSVSESTVEDMHLTVAPGSDGKEWE